MLFNSFAFLGFFLVIVALYYLSPHRYRWTLLLVASYYFYSTFNIKYLFLLGFATLVAYGFGLAIAGRYGTRAGKSLLAVALIAEVSVLALFKYFDFMTQSIESFLMQANLVSDTIALPRMDIVLPVGLSFYTFSCMSYLLDTYRGTVGAERHLGKLAVYVAFFPKLLSGPIERAPTFLKQLENPIRFDSVQVSVGLLLMTWGLFKKVVIADRLSDFVAIGFQSPAFESPITVIISVYFYAFQIYCDFSGYSDMAIGASLVLGYRLMDNFRRPYFSRSVPEFWNQRWHLSLMRWFRDYLYIPLGGSRVSTPRWYGNIMTVFLVSGLWHGAAWTFVIWGALNGLLQVLHIMTEKPRQWLARMVPVPSFLTVPLSILLTFHLIAVTWVFFRATSLDNAIAVLTRIWNAIPQLPVLIANYNWTAEIWTGVALIVLLMVVESLEEVKSLAQRLVTAPIAVRWGCYYAVIFAILWMGVWGLDDFVYMQF